MNEASETGTQLAGFIRAVRGLCGSVAGLLATADGMMASHGWEPVGGSQCWGDMSFAIDFPARWFPFEVFRFFQSAQASNVLAVITVVLDGRGEEGSHPPEEPVVGALWFHYGTEKPGARQNGWDWWYARWTTYFEPAPHGVWQTQRVADLSDTDRARHSYRFERVRGFTIPLADVTNAGVLESRIVEPLLADIASCD